MDTWNKSKEIRERSIWRVRLFLRREKIFFLIFFPFCIFLCTYHKIVVTVLWVYSVIYFPASRETWLNAASVLLLFRFIWLSAVLTPEASGIFSVPLHHPPPPPNPLCLNPLRYCSRNATDTVLKTQSVCSCMAFCLFMSVPVADGGSLSVPVLQVDVVLGSSEKQLVMTLVKKSVIFLAVKAVLRHRWPSLSADAVRPWRQCPAPLAAPLCLLFPLPRFYSFRSHVLGNNPSRLC